MPDKDAAPKIVQKTVHQLVRESRDLRERAEKLEQLAADLARQIADRDEAQGKDSN
jgi:hypothetical protein